MRRETSGSQLGGRLRQAIRGVAAAAVLGIGLSGCAGSPGPAPAATTPRFIPSPSVSSAPSPPPSATERKGAYAPTGDLLPLVTDLAAPWSVALLSSGSVLVSERDTGLIKERDAAGGVRVVGRIAGVSASGEGGLLGIAAREVGGTRELYAYLTSDSDNRVVRLVLDGASGATTLGTRLDVISGLPKAGNHNGGRIGFGPDGMLYVTVGDAGDRAGAQDPAYLGGKILRLSPDGAVPADNPITGSPVLSLGHRNPQGIAWANDGTLWAAEFGQDTWDELNRITPGANYGWPIVEGAGGNGRFVDPVAQWPTDEASPSGLAIIGDTLFMAGLGGQRLWTIDVGATVSTAAYFVGELGRIRDVVDAGDGSLLVLTNNTDGRGSPKPGDDTLYRITLAAVAG